MQTCFNDNPISEQTKTTIYETNGGNFPAIIEQSRPERQNEHKNFRLTVRHFPFPFVMPPSCTTCYENRQTMRQTPDGTQSSSLPFDECAAWHEVIRHVVISLSRYTSEFPTRLAEVRKSFWHMFALSACLPMTRKETS